MTPNNSRLVYAMTRYVNEPFIKSTVPTRTWFLFTDGVSVNVDPDECNLLF